VEIIKMCQTCWNCQNCEKFNVLFDGRWWYAFWVSYDLLSKMEIISCQKKKVHLFYNEIIVHACMILIVIIGIDCLYW